MKTIFFSICIVLLFLIFPNNISNVFSQESTINLSNNDGTSYDPNFVISGNNVYVVWTDKSSGNGDIYFKKSSDGGKTFEKTKNLSIGLDGLGKSAKVLTFQNNVAVIWDDDSDLNAGVRLRGSLDSGDSFTISKIISPKGDVDAGSHDAFINRFNGHLYVVWSNFDKEINRHNIFYRSGLNDQMNEFSNIKTLATSFDNLANPKLSSSETNQLYVFWEEGLLDPVQNNMYYNIKYKTTTNNELNFSTPRYLIKNSASSYGVKIENYNNTLYALWKDTTQNSDNLKFKILNPYQSEENISNLPSIPILNISAKNTIDGKDMAISDGTIYILWSHIPRLNQFDNYEIYLSSSSINKIDFNQPVDISNTEGNSTSPLIKVANNTIFTIWSDNTTGNGDIYFRQLVKK